MEKEHAEKKEALKNMRIAEEDLREHLKSIENRRIWDYQDLKQCTGPSCMALFNILVSGLRTDIEKLETLKEFLENANTNLGLISGEDKAEFRKEIIALSKLSSSDILLRWINSTCKRDGVICNNFSTDLQSGKVLASFLHEVSICKEGENAPFFFPP